MAEFLLIFMKIAEPPAYATPNRSISNLNHSQSTMMCGP
jgi:hypothetical protein